VELPPREQLHQELEALIDSDVRREHDCRKFLEPVKDSLFKETVINHLYHEIEYRGHTGDADYAISGKVADEGGVQCVRAYIWELKAPQCYIFEKDTQNRLRPTEDLVDAENQLLYYFHEQKGSNKFLNDFCVQSDYVHPGGIIIGCLRTRVHGDYEEAKKLTLYRDALNIRSTYFYKGAGSKLVTWDFILEQLRPPRTGIFQPNMLEQTQVPRLDKDKVTGF